MNLFNKFIQYLETEDKFDSNNPDCWTRIMGGKIEEDKENLTL